jgi:hypothetical protein
MAHDQEFFLGLAAKRKEEWNTWRHANKDVRVTFKGIDFSFAPKDEIDFSGFEFGDHADFSGCKWRGGVWQEIEEPEAFVPGRAFFTPRDFPPWGRLYRRRLRLCGQLPQRELWSSGQLRPRELR